MPKSPFDGIRLDGMIGRFDALETPAVNAGKVEPTLQVSVTGDGVSESMGLAEDIRLLITQFVHGGGDGKPIRPPANNSDSDGDVRIATHGLKLDPADEGELHRLIRERIRQVVPQREKRQ